MNEIVFEVSAKLGNKIKLDKYRWKHILEHPEMSKKYLLVAVEVLDGEGFIVTAFFTDKVKKGGLIWKKSR